MSELQRRRRKNGKDAWIIQFVLGDERRSVFLDSHYSEELARKIKPIIDELIDGVNTGFGVSPTTMGWLQRMPSDLRKRLENAGLIKPQFNPTLRELWEMYIEDESDKLKEITLVNKQGHLKHFFSVVDENMRFANFDSKVIEKAFSKLDLQKTHLTFVSKTVKRWCSWMVEKGYRKESPFKMKVSSKSTNKEREFFVSMEDYHSMLEACDSQEERALLALYRIGGLRREEALLLKWNHIDWENRKLTVLSPKTANKDKASRTIPLFPELYEELRKLNQSSEFLISFVRTGQMAYHKIVEILERAGITKYPRIVQNLRSSRANEILREFGAVAESEWLGHTSGVAQSHYLHTLEKEFEKASGCTNGCTHSRKLSKKTAPKR